MFNLFYLDCDIISNRKRKLEEMEDELFKTVYEDFNKTFEELNNHETLMTKNHRIKMLKSIAAIFFTMRLRHFCKLKKSEINTRIRHRNTKIILFKNE